MLEKCSHANRTHDYLPAAGRDFLLPTYDLITRVLGFDKAYDALVAQAELVDGLQVLDVGCGTGNVTTRVKRACPTVEVTGIDPDPLALARAQRKAQGTDIRYHRAYAQQLPFDGEKFDRIFSSMMLHHLDDDVKRDVVQEIHRVLRPSGSAHIVDIGGHPAPDDGIVARVLRHHRRTHANLGDAIPLLFRSAGFECIQVGTFSARIIGRVTFYRAVRTS
jgi:ubiquinone/menaquinone biosynthesis C-methylase UbiE